MDSGDFEAKLARATSVRGIGLFGTGQAEPAFPLDNRESRMYFYFVVITAM